LTINTELWYFIDTMISDLIVLVLIET